MSPAAAAVSTTATTLTSAAAASATASATTTSYTRTSSPCRTSSFTRTVSPCRGGSSATYTTTASPVPASTTYHTTSAPAVSSYTSYSRPSTTSYTTTTTTSAPVVKSASTVNTTTYTTTSAAPKCLEKVTAYAPLPKTVTTYATPNSVTTYSHTPTTVDTEIDSCGRVRTVSKRESSTTRETHDYKFNETTTETSTRTRLNPLLSKSCTSLAFSAAARVERPRVTFCEEPTIKYVESTRCGTPEPAATKLAAYEARSCSPERVTYVTETRSRTPERVAYVHARSGTPEPAATKLAAYEARSRTPERVTYVTETRGRTPEPAVRTTVCETTTSSAAAPAANSLSYVYNLSNKCNKQEEEENQGAKRVVTYVKAREATCSPATTAHLASYLTKSASSHCLANTQTTQTVRSVNLGSVFNGNSFGLLSRLLD